MATYVPAKVSTTCIFYVSLVSQANTNIMQVNPTIAAGDFQISIDGGALANLGTLPSVAPAASKMVKITLSTSETAGANATVVCSDVAGSEWCDLTVNVQTVARQIDDLAFPNTSGRGIDVSTGGEVGLDWANIGSPTTAVNLSATNIDTDQVVASVTGAVGSVTGLTASDVGAIKTKTDFLPSATAGSAGGVFIAGSNAATSITTALTANVTGNITGNLSGSVGSVTGNVGGNVTGSVGSVVGAVGSVTGAVGSVTGNVGGNVVGTVASVVGAVGSVTGNVGGNVTGSVGSLATQAKADVNGEVLDVLAVDTFAEPSAPPAATATLKDKIGWQGILARNKITQTATTQLVLADDGSTTVGTSTVSDNGTTATRGEFA